MIRKRRGPCCAQNSPRSGCATGMRTGNRSSKPSCDIRPARPRRRSASTTRALRASPACSGKPAHRAPERIRGAVLWFAQPALRASAKLAAVRPVSIPGAVSTTGRCLQPVLTVDGEPCAGGGVPDSRRSGRQADVHPDVLRPEHHQDAPETGGTQTDGDQSWKLEQLSAELGDDKAYQPPGVHDPSVFLAEYRMPKHRTDASAFPNAELPRKVLSFWPALNHDPIDSGASSFCSVTFIWICGKSSS